MSSFILNRKNSRVVGNNISYPKSAKYFFGPINNAFSKLEKYKI